MAAHVEPAEVPLPGNIISVILQMVTFGILSFCITRRTQHVVRWKRLPLATWLVLIIYIDSGLFVFVTAVITRGIGINESHGVCEGGILLCLICYMSTKVLIYYFLVERAYIIRGSRAPRMQTKLWLFNCLGMLLPYVIVVILNFVFRIAYINDNGVCIIGMDKVSMLPLISFDVVVNVYLTLLFIVPLRKLYSYQNNTNTTLHTMAYRSFIGSCATLTSSVVNLTVLMVLKGEPGWICLMCCNADILFSVIVLHWVTQVDRAPGNSSNHSQHNPGLSAVDIENDNNDNNTNNTNNNEAAPKSTRNSMNIWSGNKVLTEPKKVLGGTMTTEIRAAPISRRKDSDEELVEMKGIRVQTERTHEVQDVEADNRSEGSANGFNYGHYVAEREVCVEKMV